MKKKEKRIAVCDAETDPFKRGRVPEPFIWGFYDGETYEEFPSTEEFVLYLMFFDGICYAHNGGRFDWHFLLPYANAYDSVMLINGRISKMMLGDCECRDSMNIIPVSLAQMEKETIDYSIMEKGEREKPKNKLAISKYLKSDCVNLHKFVTRFIEDYGMQLTQAGAAMKQWQKISNQALPNSGRIFYHEILPYYFGGRVECFERGIIEDKFSVYDINSAYPRAMLESHPYSINYGRIAGFHAKSDFYRVRCISHGAFPFRGLGLADGHSAAGLQFPNDDISREYTITKWEYQAGLDTGTIEDVEVLESLIFMGHTDFSEYINHFYEKRRECQRLGDAAGSLFCKLLMNSLYGKFAANPENYDEYMIVPEDVVSALGKTGWSYAGDFGPWGLASTPLKEERQRFYNVATGASITGYVRAMLWRAICDAKGAIYCDTDSIAVRHKGSGIILGAALGEWKHEGNFDRAGIGGKKLYIMRGINSGLETRNKKTLLSEPIDPNYDDKQEVDSSEKENGKNRLELATVEAARFYKTASKGARLTHAQLWKVARGESVTYSQEAPTFSPKRAPKFITRKIRFTA